MKPSSKSIACRLLPPACLVALPLLGLGACGPDTDGIAATEIEQSQHSLTTGDSAFDSASCAGTALTRAQFIAKFAPGTSEAKLGDYELFKRTRTCNTVTGCSAWSAPANPGTFGLRPQPLGGALTLAISSSGNFSVRLRDGSIQEMTGYYPEFPTAGAGTLTYGKGGNYRYEYVDQNYTWSGGRLVPIGPAFRVAESLYDHSGTYTWADFEIAKITKSCARIVSKVNADTTMQYALLVRY